MLRSNFGIRLPLAHESKNKYLILNDMLMQYLACDQLECHCNNGQTSVNNATTILY